MLHAWQKPKKYFSKEFISWQDDLSYAMMAESLYINLPCCVSNKLLSMQYREIIKEALEFTQNNKRMIFWYSFFPALLATLSGIIYLTYQFFAFKSSALFENWQSGFWSTVLTIVWPIIRNNFSGTLPLLIIAGIIVILYFLIPSFCEGAIIQLIARKKNGHPVRSRHGIRYGLLSFLPLLEYSLLIRTFSLAAILGEASFIVLNLGIDALNALMPVLIILAIVGIILTVLFTYTEFFIVIDGRKVFEAIVKSCTLVVTHLESTLLLSILMLIISIRILVQIIFVLLIPIIIIASLYLFTSSAFPLIGFIVAGIASLILLYIASYLGGIIHVFAATVWTFTFLELTNEHIPNAREKMEEAGKT